MSDDESLGMLLAIAFRAMECRLIERTRGAGVMDLTGSQARIVLFITRDGVRLTELAQRSRVAKQTVAAIVERLETGGWVERVPDPSDGRARLIRFTPLAAQVWGLGRAGEDDVVAEWSEVIGADRLHHLIETLEMIRSHVEGRRTLGCRPTDPPTGEGAHTLSR